MRSLRQVGKALAFFLLLVALSVVQTTTAQDEGTAGLQLQVEAGYDGYYKPQSWLPVFVRAANDGPDIEGELRVEVGRGSEELTYNAPISLPTRSNKRVTLYVYLPALTDRLTLRLLDERGAEVAVAESNKLQQLDAEALLYGVVSDEPSALDFLDGVTGSRPGAAVALLDIEDLPAVGAAWTPLDLLVLSNVDSGRLRTAQQQALESWVNLGGQLVVTGGPTWQQTTAGVIDLLPVSVDGSRSVDDIPALRSYGGVDFRDPGPYIVASSALRSGELLLHEENLPLLARREWGRGSVTFLALDPGLAPLVDWSGSKPLWETIAQNVPDTPLWGQGVRNAYAAATAVSSLPSIRLPSGLWLFLFLGVYVAVVGPLNYVLLKRWQRREWAWLTIPVIILAFSLFAYLAGFGLRGRNVILNQMSIAYGPAGGEEMRVNTLFGVYSPRRDTYDLRLPGDVLVRPFDRNYGDMAGSGNLEAVTRGNEVLLDNVRVDVSGIETFVADSVQPAPKLDGQVTLNLSPGGAELEIVVQNNGDLVLEDAGVIFGNTFIRLGDLAPGEAASETRQLTRSQATAVAGTGEGLGPAFTSAPLSAYYDEMLGTTNYRDDPELFPRFQLLEALVSYMGPGPLPSRQTGSGGVTLMGWSDQRLLELELEGASSEERATSLYFFELPFAEVVASGEGISVPMEMLDWEVLGQSGVYAPRINSLYMPIGWVEFAYTPWSQFQPMEVTGLDLVLREDGNTTGPPPTVRLWNWQEQIWIPIPDVVWGRMTIADFEPFVGPQNEVRVRLENNTSNGVSISTVYPLLMGNIE